MDIMEEVESNFDTLQQIGTNEEDEGQEGKLVLNSLDGLSEPHPAEEELMAIDNVVEEVLQNELPKVDVIEQKLENVEDINDTNEEGNVESPTTVESFVYKCVFCEHILTSADDPKLLECLHNACGNCLNNKLYEQSLNNPGSKAQIECASCSLPCDSDKLIENQFLLELSNSEENGTSKCADTKCSSCSDDAIAVSYCVDCSEYICDSCVLAHQRLKITKDHTIKTKEEGFEANHSGPSGINSATLHCSVHPHEKLSLFCENCDKLTCRDCQLIEHRDHKYKFTHEIASDTRKYIGAMLKDVSYKRVLLSSAMKVIDDRQNLIADKKQALVKEITQLVVKLTNTINVRGKQLVSRLTEVCDQKQKTLQEKKVALDQLSKMTDHCIEFTQHALESGSDMALLYSKRQVTTHLQRIKCKRADIPNPEIPVRIHLALDKVPDLIKVISTIGQIVVDGRVYPPPTTSPATSLPPHGSPSPVHMRPPQQPSPLNHQSLLNQRQSPLNAQLQQQQPQQQSSPLGFQQPRMPPPYNQFQQQNMQPLPQTLNQKVPSGVNNNLSQMIPNIPISLAQHLQQNLQKMPLQRPPMVRPILPMRMPNSGVNHQQQQVSSSTHPQGLMQERANLRGLLQPSGGNTVYVQTGPSQYQAVQPQFAQQFQTRYSSHQVQFRPQHPPQQQQPQQQQHQQQQQPQHPIRNMMQQNQQSPYRLPVQRVTVAPIQSLQSPPMTAKWHIPQGMTSTNNMGNQVNNITLNRAEMLPGLIDNFKITLKSPNHIENKPATVSSTIPKTPSPNHLQGKSDTERNLDKYCEDSVNDLMATIAKLDSNGVQVLTEGRQKTGGSPHVDSSTDDVTGLPVQIKADSGETGKDDPNEDWCAVCMDGGELVCCDKCPKVFHQFCHIPNLSVEESDTWQCLLCVNFADTPEVPASEHKADELTKRERRIAERLILELYCQYEPSLPFREVIGAENVDYHAIIKKPIALDTIRHKLDWTSEDHYKNMEDLIKDARLMFKNAYTYNEEDAQVYTDAKTLEKFFEEQLSKLLPQYVYENFDEDSQPPLKKYKRIITD